MPLLTRQHSADGVTYYISPALADAQIPHGFATRIGGVSDKPFDSLNLGNPSGVAVQDSEERIHQNYRLLQRALGCEERTRCSVHQSHGGRVVKVLADQPHDGRARADAMVTSDPERLLSVRYADCTPVLLASEDGKRVAAIHAGWRGVIARIVPNAVEMLGVDPQRILAAIGPCIGREHFEVGAEVAEQFRREFGEHAPMTMRSDGKAMIDLSLAIRRQLEGMGICERHIDQTDRCTFRDRDEFFSHRRDGGITGRMAALIGVRA